METHSSILGKEILWTQEPGRLQSITKRLYTSELLSTLQASVSLNTASLLPDPFYICLHTQSDYTVIILQSPYFAKSSGFCFYIYCLSSVFQYFLLTFFFSLFVIWLAQLSSYFQIPIFKSLFLEPLICLLKISAEKSYSFLSSGIQYLNIYDLKL